MVLVLNYFFYLILWLLWIGQGVAKEKKAIDDSDFYKISAKNSDFYDENDKTGTSKEQMLLFKNNSNMISTGRHKRNLASVDPTQCLVSGDGLGPSIEALTTYSINLVAKDSSGNDIGTGGETFRIEIRNKCTINEVLS